MLWIFIGAAAACVVGSVVFGLCATLDESFNSAKFYCTQCRSQLDVSSDVRRMARQAYKSLVIRTCFQMDNWWLASRRDIK